MNESTKQAVFSAVRAILAIVGGSLVTHGLVSEAIWQEITGAVTLLVPVVWGVWNAIDTERKAKAREANAVNVGIKVANEASGVSIAPVHPDDVQQTIKEKS